MSQSRHFPPTGYTNLKFLTPSLYNYNFPFLYFYTIFKYFIMLSPYISLKILEAHFQTNMQNSLKQYVPIRNDKIYFSILLIFTLKLHIAIQFSFSFQESNQNPKQSFWNQNQFHISSICTIIATMTSTVMFPWKITIPCLIIRIRMWTQRILYVEILYLLQPLLP